MISNNYLEVVASGLSVKTGVKISSGKDWHYNIKTQELVYNPQDLKRFKPDVIKGLLLHETGHCLFTDDSKLGDTQNVHEIINALEDRRIEAQLNNRFGDFSDYYISELNQTFAGLYQDMSVDTFREYPRLTQALLIACLQGELGWSEYLDLKRKATPEIMQGDQLQAFEKLERLVTDAHYMANTAQVREMVKQSLDTLKPLFDPDGDQPRGGKGKATTDKPSDKAQAIRDGAGLNAGSRRSRRRADYTPEAYPEIASLYSLEIETLVRRLKSILVENTTPRLYGRFRHGKLSGRRAVDVAICNDRPFMRPGDYQQFDYAVRIALDASGSMQGEKSRGAYYASLIVLEACKRLGITCQVYAFGNDTELLATTQKPKAIENYRANQGSTRDRDALETINKATRSGDRTLVFIIGDGRGDQLRPTDSIFTELKRKGAKVFGIGIGVKDLPYPNSVYISEPGKITGLLMSKMRQVIKRREV